MKVCMCIDGGLRGWGEGEGVCVCVSESDELPISQSRKPSIFIGRLQREDTNRHGIQQISTLNSPESGFYIYRSRAHSQLMPIRLPGLFARPRSMIHEENQVPRAMISSVCSRLAQRLVLDGVRSVGPGNGQKPNLPASPQITIPTFNLHAQSYTSFS